jgi:hypothetical protein
VADDAVGVRRVVRVAGDVLSTVADEDPEPDLRSEPLGEHGAREPGAHDEGVDRRGRTQARASRSRSGHASVIGRGSPRLNRRPGV